MIENVNEFGVLPPEELAAFEIENDVRLPEDYRDFLLDSNGGVPNPNRNPIPDNVVTYILGMHNGPHFASLYKHIDIFKDRLPFSTFPFATDPFGNLFIMSLHPEGYGHIYFWDHEGEPKVQDGHYTDNCTFVAYSFSDFLDHLQ